MVRVEPHHVSITIHTKRGRQESKVIVGNDSTTEKDTMTENVRLLDEWRSLPACAWGPLFARGPRQRSR